MNEPNAPTPPPPPEPSPSAAPAFDIEKPACFYLGREYDLASGQVQPDKHVMYDAANLTTHGVIVGMTGSGKTGLGVALLEEAAIDGIPCIIIDPKGDLTNLFLQFPDLTPGDFLPWLNPDEARNKKMSRDDYANELARRWQQGLTDSYQDPKRIRLCRESSEWRIYTPGSEAGLPVSILGSFSAPKGDIPREALNQRIDATVSAVLGLSGIEADPVQSREHILIAQILLYHWTRGRDLDLRRLISDVQAPPMEQIGAFDVDTFYPEKERLKLAVALNNILASPSFSTWITGETLDLDKMLYAGDKPRQLVFYIAHLEDSQRMFFVTLLLEEVLNWTRKQTGTTSLRALLYFDEVFGYLPPHPANPPSKVPLMTLLKQARAFGVGILLAMQNPVDLDYKALSNAGTWFVGKLQTERDKARLVEGLEGVAAERGTLSDRAYLESVISALRNRIFLLHNVHQPRPIIFQSRWALSFLRGPMTRDQVALLMKPVKDTLGGEPQEKPKPEAKPVARPVQAIPLCNRCHAELPPQTPVCPKCGAPHGPALSRAQDQEFRQRLQQQAVAGPLPAPPRNRPELPADLKQFYLPLRQPIPAEVTYWTYQPRVLALAEVAFVERRKGLEHRRPYRLLAEAPSLGQVVNWMTAQTLDLLPVDHPEANLGWAPVPEALNTPKKLKALEKSFAEYLYANARLRLFENKKLGLVSQPQEDLLTFQNRCQQSALREAAKSYETEKLRYLPKFNALNLPMPTLDPLRLGGSQDQGSSLVSWVLTPFRLGASAVKAVASNAPSPSRKQRDLEAEWQGKIAALFEKWRQIGEEYGELLLTPRKVDVQVTAFGLAWAPFGRAVTPTGGGQIVALYEG